MTYPSPPHDPLPSLPHDLPPVEFYRGYRGCATVIRIPLGAKFFATRPCVASVVSTCDVADCRATATINDIGKIVRTITVIALTVAQNPVQNFCFYVQFDLFWKGAPRLPLPPHDLLPPHPMIHDLPPPVKFYRRYQGCATVFSSMV